MISYNYREILCFPETPKEEHRKLLKCPAKQGNLFEVYENIHFHTKITEAWKFANNHTNTHTCTVFSPVERPVYVDTFSLKVVTVEAICTKCNNAKS